MPTTYQFTKEKLLPIVDLFLRTGANFDEKFPSQYKRPMRLIMSENIPSISMNDGFTIIEALFTKEAISDFRKNWSHLKFSHLRDKIIFVQKWSLQLRQRDSAKQHLTYNNLTVFLSIEQFKPVVHEVPSTRQIWTAKSLFKDEKIISILDNTRHAFLQNLIETKYRSIEELDDQMGVGSHTMPSLKSLMSSSSKSSEILEDAKTAESQAASAGVIRLNLPASFVQPIHVEGHPDQLSKAMMQHLRADFKDFQELAWHFNEDAFGGDGAGS